MATKKADTIPVIDIFAGPGGLGEGFSSLDSRGGPRFKIGLSVEKDPAAHKTLELRSFYRQFPRNRAPADYYRHLRGEITREQLFDRHPEQSTAAKKEARCEELGNTDENALDRRIKKAIGVYDNWVLIGGPPCQAFSTAGRSRNKGIKGYRAENDARHFLYQEYLRIIAKHWPAVFVMENVKGILSAKVNGRPIFDQILDDLHNPARAFKGKVGGKKKYDGYLIFSLVNKTEHDIFGFPDFGLKPASQFLIESENYGIPQTRHRVILLGVRSDIAVRPGVLKPESKQIAIDKVLKGLPRLRSGLSQAPDSDSDWRKALKAAPQESWFRELESIDGGAEVAGRIERTVDRLRVPRSGRGGEFLAHDLDGCYREDWYVDERLGGVCNSSTRAHIESDLHRYLFAASYASVHGCSPRLKDFPTGLHPEHKNVSKAMGYGHFSDRFRVQEKKEPASTVVSHIAKDGHYYIHWDPSQCRSLTVREAARLQTFPDNYFFCGNRTEQYSQVGNAVPPLLAQQIAKIVREVIKKA